MNKFIYSTLFMMTIIMSFTSCEVIKGIFQAGVWTGILLIVVIVAIIIFIISKTVKK